MAIVTFVTFFSMSSASLTVRVETEPSPPRTPPTVVAPGTMISTFVPRLEISAWTDARRALAQADHRDDGADADDDAEHGQPGPQRIPAEDSQGAKIW